jgi:PHD/YefM family antitoxin component YafN of YafNO toxin-antitoxin module
MNTLSSFPNTISTRDIQRNYAAVFSQVNQTNMPTVVIANNKPQVAIISLDTYNEFAEYVAAKKLWASIDKLKKKNQKNDQVALQEEIAQAISEVRHDLYE